jgi:hypothetical protein
MPNKKAMSSKLRQQLEPWVAARKRLHLSHAHVQMARELGLNPHKLGKLANDDQEPWKMSLPAYIGHLYEKQFGRTRPEVVRTIEEIGRLKQAKAEARKDRRAARQAPANQTADDAPTLAPELVRGSGVQARAQSQSDINAEVAYVQGLASEGIERIVRLGPLLLFATDTGDAWLLDADDHTALPLARSGSPLPVRILEFGYAVRDRVDARLPHRRRSFPRHRTRDRFEPRDHRLSDESHRESVMLDCAAMRAHRPARIDCGACCCSTS